jgi:hypothetical protein
MAQHGASKIPIAKLLIGITTWRASNPLQPMRFGHYGVFRQLCFVGNVTSMTAAK